MIVPIGPDAPITTMPAKVPSSPATATPSTTSRCWTRRRVVTRRRSRSARRRSRMSRSVAALISAWVLVLVGFPLPAAAEGDPEEGGAAGEQREQHRHVEDPQNEPGVRDPELLGPADVVVRRLPEVRCGPVVALHPPAGPAVAADGSGGDDMPCADLTLRYAVGDDLADVVVRVVLDEDEVAGMQVGQHARAAHE